MKLKTFKQFLKEQSSAEEKFEELIILIPPNWKIKKLTLLEERRWVKFSDNLEYRIDKRPGIYGGDQIHIRNRNGGIYAYLKNGERSEKHKYKLKASREVKKLVRTVFQLPDDFLIEHYLNIEALLVKADGSQILVEL